MRIFYIILGCILGNLGAIFGLAVFSVLTDSEMPDTFFPVTIGGIIGAIALYKTKKDKK